MIIHPHILAVDDDPLILDLIQDALSQDYQVEVTSDPHQALDLLDREPFDMLLIDLGIPEVDGAEIIRHVRSHPFSRNLPIVVVSAYIELAKRVAGLNVQAILRKPFQLDQLYETLGKVLSESRMKSNPSVNRQ